MEVGAGGGLGDWEMRSEEHSREEPGMGVCGGGGGGGGCWAGRGGCEAGRSGAFRERDCACCSHIDRVLGSTGHADESVEGAGVGGGGTNLGGSGSGTGSAFHHPIAAV